VFEHDVSKGEKGEEEEKQVINPHQPALKVSSIPGATDPRWGKVCRAARRGSGESEGGEEGPGVREQRMTSGLDCEP